MSVRVKILMKSALACAAWAAIASSAQAATTMTADPSLYHGGELSWQNINGVSYTFADTNGDHVLEVGEKVTFTVDMHKYYYGTHQFDALKVWLDDPSIHPAANLYTGEFSWYYAVGTVPGDSTVPFHGVPGEPYTTKRWDHGDNYFSFSYTFDHAGSFDLLASVTCSMDLSGLDSGGQFDKPTTADWDAWGRNVHATAWLQGEDKGYHLTVAALPPVPEPETYAMLMAGLGLMAAIKRRRKPRA